VSTKQHRAGCPARDGYAVACSCTERWIPKKGDPVIVTIAGLRADGIVTHVLPLAGIRLDVDSPFIVETGTWVDWCKLSALEPRGSSACPSCGVSTPHLHRRDGTPVPTNQPSQRSVKP
jgi:hypothetical protein